MHPHTAGQKMNGNLLAQKKLLSAVTPSGVPLLCSKWHEFFGLSVSLSLSLCLPVFLSFCLISFLCVCLSVSISFSVFLNDRTFVTVSGLQSTKMCSLEQNVCLSVFVSVLSLSLSLSLSVWMYGWSVFVSICYY